MILAAALALAAPCEQVEPPPATFQVAWVSPLERTVGRHTPLEVVRVSDLRQLVEGRGRHATRVLRALGLLGPRGEARRDYKVTVFDVEREWLCRPMRGVEGTEVGGVPICAEDWQGPAWGTRPRSHTGCGYLQDADTAERTLDVYRLDWSVAVSRGFCVLPLRRFLEGA